MSTLIYTIGHAETYNKLIEEGKKEHKPPKKKGRTKSYNGGSVWKKREDAEKYLQDKGMTGYSVYGVLACWRKDTAPHPGQPFNDLLTDSIIVELE